MNLVIPKNIIYMLKGLPASGKSTYAENMVNVKRVSKDDLRTMIDGGEYTKENEMFVLDVRNYLVGRALELGFDVVVDDTNLNPAHEEALRDLAEIHLSHVEVFEMDTSLDECIKRDANRPNSIGEDVIRGMAAKYGVAGPVEDKRDE